MASYRTLWQMGPGDVAVGALVAVACIWFCHMIAVRHDVVQLTKCGAILQSDGLSVHQRAALCLGQVP